MTAKKLTLVVPVLNEERCVAPFAEAVRSALEGRVDWEILFVDDNSSDGTQAAVRALHQADPRIKALFMTRRFGHQVALAAGIDVAGGDAVVTMDVDFEHPPELLPQLVSKWTEGYPLVIAVKETTRGIPGWRRAGAALLYWILARISSAPPTSFAADFRLLDRRVVLDLRRFEERNRFIRGLVSWIGYSQATIAYVPGRRQAGETKFNFRRLWKLAFDGIFSFSYVPLRAVALCGLAASAVAFALGTYYFIDALIRGKDLKGWASLFVSVTFFGGVQLLLTGVMGEYVVRIYDEVKRRPLYVVRESVGLEPLPRNSP